MIASVGAIGHDAFGHSHDHGRPLQRTGFELGYALGNPNLLVLREGKNLGLCQWRPDVFTQFLMRGETKWLAPEWAGFGLCLPL